MSVPRDDAEPGPAGGLEFDRAIVRLEEVLLSLPFDRALPDLGALLARADVSPAILQRDDRVLKVLHEAIIARPYGDLDEVLGTRAEVELCTLEVEVLTERLRDHPEDVAVAEGVTARLATVRARLREIQDGL